MQVDNFINFLNERNNEFIDYISAESALWMSGKEKEESKDKKKCILISFDPPLAYPPFAFNFNNTEIKYFKSPELNFQSYKEIANALSEVEHPYIVFLERKDPAHKRKIVRFIKNFKESVFRNDPATKVPKFILAEYKAPLFGMSYSELKAD